MRGGGHGEKGSENKGASLLLVAFPFGVPANKGEKSMSGKPLVFLFQWIHRGGESGKSSTESQSRMLQFFSRESW